MHLRSNLKLVTSATLAFLLITNSALAQEQIPKANTKATLKTLKISESAKLKDDDIVGYKMFKKDVKPDSIASQGFGGADSKLIPYSGKGSMILSLEPNLSKQDVEDLLNKYDFEVGVVIASIDTIQVKTDLSEYFQGDPTVDHAAYLRGIIAAAEDFQKDPRVTFAAPDTILTTEDTVIPFLQSTDFIESPIEIVGWGPVNIEADKLWNNPDSENAVTFGILDAGFGRHQDLSFMGIPQGTKRNDHGNHVAGIACAKHNGIGIKGVLPNCNLNVASGDRFSFASVPATVKMKFLMSFMQTLESVASFVEREDGISVYNLSLGYNWMPNFQINIDKPANNEQKMFRNIVEMQGQSVIRILENAKKNDKVIYSAAGNDSSELDEPMSAFFASPFNFGAIEARKLGKSNNGIVVEAHDRNGIRAIFSNNGGHISCPGVGILSAVAYDENGDRSDKAYARKSGTSMASPFCASAHLLLKQLRPNYSNAEIANCLIESAYSVLGGAPQLKLTQALATCPRRSL